MIFRSGTSEANLRANGKKVYKTREQALIGAKKKWPDSEMYFTGRFTPYGVIDILSHKGDLNETSETR